MRGLAFAFLVAAGIGCYRFTPIKGGAPMGTDVRMELTDAGAVRLAPLIGPRIAAIDGRTVAESDSALEVAVQAVVDRGGRSMPWSLERLAVPYQAIAALKQRTLDTGRSWLVAGLTVAGALLVADAFDLVGSGGFFRRGDSGGRK